MSTPVTRPPPSQVGSARWRPADRLRHAADVTRVQDHGRVWRGRFVVLKLLPAPDGRTRCAMVASRRFSLEATRRNRARRLLREALRLLRGGLTEPLWIVAIARGHLSGRCVQDVQTELVRLFGQAGCWRP